MADPLPGTKLVTLTATPKRTRQTFQARLRELERRMREKLEEAEKARVIRDFHVAECQRLGAELNAMTISYNLVAPKPRVRKREA